MANWISNKLKVAETFLQQIDQQAAESLSKGENPRSDDLKIEKPSKSSGSVSLKDQLKKKTQENDDYKGKLRSGTSKFNTLSSNNLVGNPSPSLNPNSNPKSKSSLTDSDWTQLLSTPEKPASSGSRRKLGGLGNRSQKGSNSRVSSGGRLDVAFGSKVNGGKKLSDGDDSGSSGRSSNVELQNNEKNLGGGDVKLQKDRIGENGDVKKSHQLELVSALGKVDVLSDVKIGSDDASDRLSSAGNYESSIGSRTSVSDNLKRVSSSLRDNRLNSDLDSGSDSELTSGSESEHEREEKRKQREKILAERAAAKAVEAIKERENMVARLEGEKQSLEKILEERAKQQAKEASELQTTTMETMEAVELEKQRHNNTRMEALARLAKLETANADLARSLATAQKKLEVETDQMAELRQKIELKEMAHEELSRSIANTDQKGTFLSELAASKGIEFEREIVEAEYSFITDKIGQLQDKAKKLEEDIEMTKAIEDPTEVEIELKRRLGQLTDHLIQKQAQVESLSSEKATLLFRIEAVSRLLEENKSMSNSSSRDLESGVWEFSQSKLRPHLVDKIQSGRKHIGSLVLQLDSIFLAGMVFLRRNSTAKLWSLVYLVCLHFWVIYILMSHSNSSNETRSGAVFSLENINNTAAL
ncbi:golgin candidate 2-like [Mangifera indica]|uniref:golgin candidate 2-like n=1 Tax=Mangifera indica TaxID=29780 RepID=UPI001CFC0F99|nr:golgin candidate 2-like [Mangifera indica]